MPARTDIRSILIFGSGPIVIGQACEFDYSGVQAVRALKEEGYRVILLNSNPATIMTDPELADRTYIEPMTVEIAERIIEAEKPDALLPTLGGQTALNLALDLADAGILERHGVELIGANVEAIRKAEDRDLFKQAMIRIGLDVARSGIARSMQDAMELIGDIGFPAIIRPAFTLGGTGGGIAYNMDEYREIVAQGLARSPVSEVLVEESILGWKEYEMEVMRDHKDQVVIICSIENLDPMGVHTGDSITVAPAQTLTDKEYQILRDASIAIMREIGVDTGGSNVQFAVDPDSGRVIVIEMNPRVSRSSALASKATGFPIAKIAAKLAVGYSLDELRNDITRETPASFEPTIDYVVTKMPRFTFEKFPGAEDYLTTSMKSVGEAMAIGRTFAESLQKGMRSLEIDSYGFESQYGWDREWPEQIGDALATELRERCNRPNSRRLWTIGDAFRAGFSVEDVWSWTKIDRWFLAHIERLIQAEREWLQRSADVREAIEGGDAGAEMRDLLRRFKRLGFSDRRLAVLAGVREQQIRALRHQLDLRPVYKLVDTCAGEFAAYTPYLYSTYEDVAEVEPMDGPKVAILGGGPNRIGQGIEFDYCCVHACMALQDAGYKAIMVNCNPETVSTDYDTSDRLFFEPLTEEDVLEVLAFEGVDGVVLQFGGQTPLKLARALEREDICVMGTSPDAIDESEDRDRFQKLVDRLGLLQPRNGIARSVEEAVTIARDIGYPLVVRPSYVLGGRAMEIVYDESGLQRYMAEAVRVSPEQPVLLDAFLERATEFDVDAVGDGERIWIGGIMQHVEAAGVHSGDSGCSLPPVDARPEVIETMREQTRKLGHALNVIGLMNVQFAVQDDRVYLLEVNPRASRTAPFVSKSVGVPLAKLATWAMLGKPVPVDELPDPTALPHVSVKESVFPFHRFPNVDTLLGPEMKSTGEVMGIDRTFPVAFAKASAAAGTILPREGCVFLSVHDRDKPYVTELARILAECGFRLIATRGTAAWLQEQGIEVTPVNKVREGHPHIVDAIRNGEVQLVINTPTGFGAKRDSYSIRRSALEHQVPYFTTIEAARAAALAIRELQRESWRVCPIQDWHAGIRAGRQA